MSTLAFNNSQSPAGQGTNPDSDSGSDVEMIEEKMGSECEDDPDMSGELLEPDEGTSLGRGGKKRRIDQSEEINSSNSFGGDDGGDLGDEDVEEEEDIEAINDEYDDEDNDGLQIKQVQSLSNLRSRDDEDILYVSDDDDDVDSDELSKAEELSKIQASFLAKAGITIEAVSSSSSYNNKRHNKDSKASKPTTIEDDDVVEIAEEDPLGLSEDFEPKKKSREEENKVSSSSGRGDASATIVVNDTKSLVELANSKKEPGKEPTLVIIDTNAILSGKGPLPMASAGVVNKSNGRMRAMERDGSRYLSRTEQQITIPDDAFLIEAPSFIVPYVFEQIGEQTLKDKLRELAEAVAKERERKIAAEEVLDEDDEIKIPKREKTDDYFCSPVGRLLMNVGMNLVQEYVQVDLLKMQKRKADQERKKSRSGGVAMQTQQSIISLKQNIEESKENNEPFRHPMKKCELCNFKTESALVMSAHLETPHMRNYSYRCNFCSYMTRVPQEVLFHMEAEHAVQSRLERAPAYHQCPNCAFEDNSKAKLTRHLQGCTKRFKIEKNLEPPFDWDTPAKLPKLPKSRLLPQGSFNSPFLSGNLHQAALAHSQGARFQNSHFGSPKILSGGKMTLPPLMQAPKSKPLPGLIRTNPNSPKFGSTMASMQRGMMMRNSLQGSSMGQSHLHLANNQILQQVVTSQLTGASPGSGGYFNKMGMMQGGLSNLSSIHKSPASLRNMKPSTQPSISITPLPRHSAAAQPPPANFPKQQPGNPAKTSFVICEICDGYIKDLDQLRNHMQWIHKVKIHPKMIYNKPPLNCQKCQFRFFTDQGLERHLLGSHGLVTSSMQEAANKGQDSGRCPLCGKVYQWKLLAHVAKDHNVTLKPAHLSYKCTVCTATFGMYKLFESHVYSAHSMTAKRGAAAAGGSAGAGTSVGRPPGVGQGVGRGNQMQVTSRPMPSTATSAGQNSNYKPMKINDEITIIPQAMAGAGSLKSKGSLTITPQSSSARRGNDDDGIQIIEIDEAPKNGRSHNGDMKSRLSINDPGLRKRNLEISLCGDSDNSSEGEMMITTSRGPPQKRLKN